MNAKELAQRMAQEAATIIPYLLPRGKKKGSEWKAGDLTGGEGDSLSVRLTGSKAGVWSDFATGQAGDILDLWANCKCQSIPEAINEAKRFLGINDAMPMREKKAYTLPKKPQCSKPKGKVQQWLNSRGIEDRTIDAFKVAEMERDGKFYAVFPYLRDGQLINAKYRNADEKKDMRQEAGAEPCLYGWHTIDPKARQVAICEGEIDAMTLHQAGIPALSCNAGAGNFQWLENDYDRLDRFDDILIAYDDDEQGNKGAQELIRRLGVERCRRMTFEGKKDANEYLLSGADGEDFWHLSKMAKFIDPDELRQASDFIELVKAMFYPVPGEVDPILSLDEPMPWFEFRMGELTVWTGINGHGKSLMLSQVQLGLMAQGEKFCVFSGEMSPQRQVKRMSKQITGMDRPPVEMIDEVGRFIHDRYWVFNLVGTAKIDRLIEVFTYAKKRYGIRHFVIDSLMCIDVPEDGNGAITAQKQAIQKMCNFVRQYDCHMHLVAHPRKPSDEKHIPGKMDVAGSSKITDGADNVFTVWSALHDENEAPTNDADAKLILNKQRNGECQHRTVPLWFVKEAQQFSMRSQRYPRNYMRAENETISSGF